MNRIILLYPFLFITLWSCQSNRQPDNDVFNVMNFGALPGSSKLNTNAIQKAIDAASENRGGIVYFPPGIYTTGTIYLRDNVTLHIAKGAIVKGSANVANYAENKNMSVRSYTYRYSRKALIWADSVKNIAIIGLGEINGNSSAMYADTTNKAKGKKPLGVRLINCKNVLIRDINLKQAGYWMLHCLNCNGVTIDNIKVFNHHHHTNDGIDLDACKNVRVSNCYVDSHDDALVFKSTVPDVVSGNITVTNCIFKSHCHGMKMGTETLGGFKRINISNCVVQASDVPHPKIKTDRPPVITAIALEIVDGGTMEDIVVNNITAEHVFAPVFIKLGNRGRGLKGQGTIKKVGTIKNITISNLTATGAGPFSCSITGIPEHYIENITLQNIYIKHVGGGRKEEIMKNVPENSTHYPEIKMFGNNWKTGPRLPSYGFFVRHVKNIRFINVQLELLNPDDRQPVIIDDVLYVQNDALSKKLFN